MINVAQRAGNGVGTEEADIRNPVAEDNTEKGMTELVDGRTQPGQQINAAAERALHRPEGKLGDKLDQQPENKEAGQQESHLAEGGRASRQQLAGSFDWRTAHHAPFA